MTKTLPSLLLSIVLLACGASVHAQSRPPRPGPEVNKLGYLLGHWEIVGQIGGLGQVTATEDNQWLPGRFFLVSRYNFKTRLGTGSWLEILGYDSHTKHYTFDSFDNTGQHQVSTGTLKGHIWTWYGKSDKTGHAGSRVVDRVLSPTSYDFEVDSWNGSAWSTVLQGVAKKAKE